MPSVLRFLFFLSLLGFLGCGRPLLSIDQASAIRLPDDRVRLSVVIKNIGNVPWIGSTEGASDEICLSASWIAASEPAPLAEASSCFSQPLRASSSATLFLTSSFSLPASPSSEIRLALFVRFPNPSAQTTFSLPSP